MVSPHSVGIQVHWLNGLHGGCPQIYDLEMCYHAVEVCCVCFCFSKGNSGDGCSCLSSSILLNMNVVWEICLFSVGLEYDGCFGDCCFGMMYVPWFNSGDVGYVKNYVLCQ